MKPALMAALVAAPLAAAPSAPASPDRWAGRPHGPVYAVAPPMHDTVERRLMPQVEGLLAQLLRERREMVLGGVKVFDSGDKFLPGKIAAAMTYHVLDVHGDPRLEQRLAEYADIADLTLDDANDSWGIYYYVSALHQLKEAGLLDRAVRPATLAKLRVQLDWRRFVRPDLSLINLPNNYYGVAFSVARFRFLMGWEDASASEALLAKMIEHYRLYSGKYGFADETEGDGRFDRYSVLLIGEIAQRLVETGMAPTPDVKQWLRRSVDLMLPRFNLGGEGFEYGRSIGTYGETAFLEVLTAAARFKVLSPVEERMAYAFSSRVAARYMDFWVDPATGSVDMWDHGRRTDSYRGKHRIFGENLSLARQYIYTDAIWNELGYRGKAPAADYARWLDRLPRSTTTWFARGAYDRALVTIRDRGHVIGLPIINGAVGQHMNTPYFPVPFSPGLLQGSADAKYPHLVPRITLADGSVLMPLAWFRNVAVTRRGAATEVRWRQDALDLMGASNARRDDRVAIETRYVFAPGRITRSDSIAARPGVDIKRIDLEFATFSNRASTRGATVRFGHGEVAGFEARNLGDCTAVPVDADPYRAPTGPFSTVVRCGKILSSQGRKSMTTLSLSWTLSYNYRDLN
ncbi:MAG: hypothetical protein WC729_22325 [Sphingomonas sp.]|jgi:hypothetical protein|uniref:hypothetical protein n=1 Tax=Sphingomonas sp. TaxID=28214 RepID=UPI0035684C63